MAYTVSVLSQILFCMTWIEVIFAFESQFEKSPIIEQLFAVAALQPNRPFCFGLTVEG